MDKKTKITLILISIVMIVVAIIIVLTKSVPPTTSAESINVDFSDQTVNSLRFTNANIVDNQLKVYVQNTTVEEYNLNSITVKFLDQDNNELDSVDSYIGESISPNEIRNLDVKTDVDLSSTKTIIYTVNK